MGVRTGTAPIGCYDRVMRTTLLALCMLASAASAEPKRSLDPATIVFVVDRSSSMRGPALDLTKAAIGRAIATLPTTDRVAVVAFDTTATIHVPLGAAGPDPKRDAAIDQIAAAGATSYAPALEAARGLLARATTHRKHIIFVSDGGSSAAGLDAHLAALEKDQITLSAISLASGGRKLLSTLAEAGAGRLYGVEDVRVLDRLVLHEIGLATASP